MPQLPNVDQALARVTDALRDAAPDVPAPASAVPRAYRPEPLPPAAASPEVRPVSRPELETVAQVGARNDRRSFALLHRQARQIADLRQANDDLARQVAALRRAQGAVSGLAENLSGLERSVDDVKAQGRRVSAAQRADRRLGARQRARIAALRTQARLDAAASVVNTAQATAYGQRGSLLATNNLLLAGNQAFWTFLDPVLQRFGITSGATPSLAAWLAPLGTLLTGQAALAGRQHLRFVSGTADFDGSRLVVAVSLQGHVAQSIWPEVRRRVDIPVTITQLGATGGTFAARVSHGNVLIAGFVGEIATPLAGRVLWVVDLGEDFG